MNKLKPRSKTWIEFDEEVVFGAGRAALFQAIEETGSIRQAANKLGMSYRAAWGKIKATEERLGIRLVEKYAGGLQSGAVLTPQAKELMEIFQQFKKDSEASVDELFIRHFNKFFSS
ncbi:winged helix-turn-helix domain-containing protein [Phosphitispora sp. TUW77]|uniref:winged helix-turn-helix domain-containing protein n=1 Tax=Phosphitispora sp. TUW77 TaxID=3152361 RepID=UPI003AB22F8C